MDDGQTLPWLLGLAAVLGLVMGSFATMLCYRIPREIPLGLFSHQRSRCPQCDALIPWYRNIPIVSYVLQRGRCASCDKPIPRRYFMIELTTCVLFVATTWIQWASPTAPVEEWAWWLDLAKNLAFTLALIATVFIDIEFRIIPDRFSLGGWVVALIASFVLGHPAMLDAVLGGLFGAGMFWLLAWGYEKLKGVEGLGFGDVKMMGWLGSWLGLMGVPTVILIGSITGLIGGFIAMRRSKDGWQTAVPFGPFLALGAYVVWVLQSLGLWAGVAV